MLKRFGKKRDLGKDSERGRIFFFVVILKLIKLLNAGNEKKKLI